MITNDDHFVTAYRPQKIGKIVFPVNEDPSVSKAHDPAFRHDFFSANKEEGLPHNKICYVGCCTMFDK